MSRVNTGVRVRTPGPLRLAFTQTVKDWYYGLIPFSVVNFAWFLMVLTVVAGPPATAAMLMVARDAATGHGVEPGNFFLYVRQFFWRAWQLGILTFLGSLVVVTDFGYYTSVMRGVPILLNVGVLFLVYVLVMWVELLLIAWPILVDQPEMAIRDVVRNAAILTLRLPGANLGLALLVILLFLFSLPVAVGATLALAALVSLLVQHYLNIQAPALANFVDRPGAGAVPPESEL